MDEIAVSRPRLRVAFFFCVFLVRGNLLGQGLRLLRIKNIESFVLHHSMNQYPTSSLSYSGDAAVIQIALEQPALQDMPLSGHRHIWVN